MKVLAYRSNLIFITAPILVPICFFIFICMVKDIVGSWWMYSELWWSIFITDFMIMLSQTIGFVERLFMPKVLIEYDDHGLYIYKYKNSEPILLRYEQIWGFCAHTNYGAEDYSLSQNFNPNTQDSYEKLAISYKEFVGMLKINTPYEIVTVHGIKDVKSVERELASLKYAFKEKQEAWLDYNAERSKREKELEELAKHDVNT